MVKLVGMVLLVGGIFWAGYYVGQQPAGEVKHQLRSMSEGVVERAFGLEKGELNLQREFLQAKSRILEGKAELIDGEYEEAAEELDEALQHLKNAVSIGGEKTSQSLIDGLMAKVNDMKQSLKSGQHVSRETIDEAQKELDSLLSEQTGRK